LKQIYTNKKGYTNLNIFKSLVSIRVINNPHLYYYDIQLIEVEMLFKF